MFHVKHIQRREAVKMVQIKRSEDQYIEVSLVSFRDRDWIAFDRVRIGKTKPIIQKRFLIGLDEIDKVMLGIYDVKDQKPEIPPVGQPGEAPIEPEPEE